MTTEWITEDSLLRDEGYSKNLIENCNGRRLKGSLNIEFEKIKISKRDVNKYLNNSKDEDDDSPDELIEFDLNTNDSSKPEPEVKFSDNENDDEEVNEDYEPEYEPEGD